MFNEEQLNSLINPLDNNRIKSRSKGNVNLSYLEGFDILDTANRIFGYGNWGYKISILEQVSQETNQNQNHVLCYKAVIQIVIHNINHTQELLREDVGFGTGIAKTLADAHENAAKEAVTDAIKRALRSFGNQFGNSLYDKSRNHNNASLNNPSIQNTNNSNSQQFQQTMPSNQIPNTIPQDYSKLYNLGLQVIENENTLIVMGDDIFAKKDAIKSHGFRWDGANRLWYKQLEQGAA